MESSSRRSTRATKEPERLTYSHAQEKRHVTFDEATLLKVEQQHNIQPTDDTMNIPYDDYIAPVAVRIMAQLILKVAAEQGYASFAQ